MNQDKLLDIFSRQPKFQKTGDNQYKCCCPAHNDKNPSLSVKFTEDRVLLNDFAGCGADDICRSLGLELKDLFFDSDEQYSKVESNIQAEYRFYDETGKYRYSKLRFAVASGEKKIRFAVSTGNGYEFQNITKDRFLYNLPQIKMAIENGCDTVYIAEGEKDVDTLSRLGLLATTSGSSTSWKEEFAQHFKDLNVIILRDNDQPGLEYANSIVKSIYKLCKSYKVVLTSQKDKGDVTDYLEEGHNKEELLRLIGDELFIVPTKAVQEKDNSNAKTILPEVINLDSVPDTIQKFVWYPYIPAHKTTLLFAPGGSGKSWAAALIASTLSRKERFLEEEWIPKEMLSENNGIVLWLDSEEDGEDMKARLKACNADLSNIRFVDQKIARLNGTEINIKLFPQRLKNLIEQNKPVLTILNPWQSFTGTMQSNEQTEVRAIMDTIGGIAKETDCAILLIGHSNKKPQELNANNAAMGSSDFINAVRSAFTVVRANKDDSIKTLVHTKCNDAPLGKSVDFRIGGERYKPEVKWQGLNEDVTKETLEDAAAMRKRIYDFIKDKAAKEEKRMELVDVLQELARDVKEGEKKFFAYADIRERYGDEVIGARPAAEIEKAGIFLTNCKIKIKKQRTKKSKDPTKGIEIFKELKAVDFEEF